MKPISSPPFKLPSSPLDLNLATSNIPATILSVKALTWLRDSHGLFDYESFQLTKNTLKIENGCIIARLGTEVRTFNETELKETEIAFGADKLEKLAEVVVSDGIF